LLLKANYTQTQIENVIDSKCNEWLGTDMSKYLRPETLFGSKFEGYLNEGKSGKANDSVLKDVFRFLEEAAK